MKKIVAQAARFKWQLLLALLMTVGGTMSMLILPNLLSRIVNAGSFEQSTGYIVRIGLAMLGVSVGAMLANVAASYFSARAASGFAAGLRGMVFRKVEEFSQVEFDRFETPSLITRNTNDVLQLQNFLTMLTRVMVQAPILIVGGAVMAYSQSPALAKPLLYSIPSIVLLIVVISRVVMPLFRQLQEKVDGVNLVLREKLSGIRVIRAFLTEDYEEQRFDRVNRDLGRINLRMMRIMSLLMPLLMILMNLTTILIVYQGGLQVDRGGGLLAGDVLAVIQYVTQILFSLVMMSMIFVLYPRASASAARIAEVLDTDVSITDREKPVTGAGQRGVVEFRDVSFTFPGAERPTLQHISFRSGPGEITAIIGSTGSGKSSLLHLIPRFYDVGEGQVLVDGVDVRDWSQQALRSRLGYVPQKSTLFSGTVAGNIRYGDGDASPQAVEEAARIAQALEFVQNREKGFEAPVSQGATNLSGGQKQRLSIARAVVRSPEIYLFDDSFSALDFKTDARLRAALREKTGDATVLLVAQRVSSILDADRILVLSEGKLAGVGTHRELLASCQVYQEIVASQFTDEEVAG